MDFYKDKANSTTKDTNSVYQYCVGLLARREHSAKELRQKTQQRGIDANIFEDVLKKLIAENSQSDERFAEIFTRSRVRKKHGAKKIFHELKQKGVDESVAIREIAKYSDVFLDHAKQLIERKAARGNITTIFGNRALKYKITQSLSNKGYDFDTIRLAFERLREEQND